MRSYFFRKTKAFRKLLKFWDIPILIISAVLLKSIINPLPKLFYDTLLICVLHFQQFSNHFLCLIFAFTGKKLFLSYKAIILNLNYQFIYITPNLLSAVITCSNGPFTFSCHHDRCHLSAIGQTAPL